MEKSKQIMNKSLIIIGLTMSTILFIESTSCSPIRAFISSKIIFFQGKGTLISNICLGILGSAVLTYVNERIEFQTIKKKLEGDILRFYIKWMLEIRFKTLFLIKGAKDNIQIIENICQCWEEINSIYHAYLPYRRNGMYVELTRELYNYFKEFKTYIEDNYHKQILGDLGTKFMDYMHETAYNSTSTCDNDDEEKFINSIKSLECDMDKKFQAYDIMSKYSEFSSAEEQDYIYSDKTFRKKLKILKIKRLIKDIIRFYKNIRSKCKSLLTQCKNFFKKRKTKS